jgi:hypothetical protein
MKRSKKYPKKRTNSINKRSKKTKRRSTKQTLFSFVTALILGFIACRLFRSGHKLLGSFVGVIALVNVVTPFVLPEDYSLYTNIASLASVIVPVIVMPLISITNLISPKTAKKLI